MDTDTFYPEEFFDFSSFPFAAVFLKDKPVWSVLSVLSQYIKQQFDSGVVKGNYKENVFIGEGTTVHSSAEIIGPAVIGKNCTIAHGAYLRENCFIGDNVTIGHAVEVKNSVILHDAACAHLNYVGDSIIGSSVNIGGGAIIANTRLDKKNVGVKTYDEKIDTGLNKMGAIIGDNSSIGANAVLNPGTVLGKNSFVYPLTSVNGFYVHGSHVK